LHDGYWCQMPRTRFHRLIDRLSEMLPAWSWILIGWLVGGGIRLALEASLGEDAGPFAFVVVILLWLPALSRLADVPTADQIAFAAAVLATILLVGLLPPFEHIALRLPVEIALTVPAAARWIDGASNRSRRSR
jgi:hypothetical protein